MTKTFFVRGYGYHENNEEKHFQGVIDVENPNSTTITNTIISTFNFSQFRSKKEIIIEQINAL